MNFDRCTKNASLHLPPAALTVFAQTQRSTKLSYARKYEEKNRRNRAPLRSPGLRCPKIIKLMLMNFDRCAKNASLHLPPAALAVFAQTQRTTKLSYARKYEEEKPKKQGTASVARFAAHK